MNKLTEEQQEAILSRGRTIVSASAGSGKTFVMIEKLTNAVADGADLDEVLAVTFTKKAAAQIKEKLRKSLIGRLENADDSAKARLKVQLSKISSANISTIHSLCSGLLRTYFYALGIDGGFDIISSDDAQAKDLKARAIESLFEKLYAEDDADFKHLLQCFMRKRSDSSLKRLLDEAYGRVRSTAHYGNILSEAEKLYTKEGFDGICNEYNCFLKSRYNSLLSTVEEFRKGFAVKNKAIVYDRIFCEMAETLKYAAQEGVFAEKRPLTQTRKPADGEDDREEGERFKKFKDSVAAKYKALLGDFESKENEFEYFLKSGRTAVAFARILMQFDGEYTSVKRAENKLDYNDLEHLTLELLQNEEVRTEINSKYKYVFVDEYQDVNPVQEEIISSFGGEIFLVGDVKQAIYGFRGSKSLFFAEKYKKYLGGDGRALKLSNNFRSSDGVLDFCNSVFSQIMRTESCGFDYAKTGVMRAGGKYPQNYGSSELHFFGKQPKAERDLQVYSVIKDGRDAGYTREGLAVLAIVEDVLSRQHFDLDTGGYRDTQPSDICILTRKNKGGSTEGIVKALRGAGYSVAGAQESNICVLPEVKQFLDILSLIDNAEQDIPLVTVLLSPLGDMTEDELAAVRIAFKNNKSYTFRQCCQEYADKMRGNIASKLNIFYDNLKKLRSLAELLPVYELADVILEDYGLETCYGAYGEEKMANVRKLLEEGNLPVGEFLQKIKSGGFEIPSAAPAPSDSIKIMTMHASKGLEFPVVIIADICKTFKGADYTEMPFDDYFGFAPKYYDTQNMLTHKTVLRRLVKLRADSEELKNEYNLFYVACTRAKCNLHILAEEVKPYDEFNSYDAGCYADMFDMSKYLPTEIQPHSAPENTVVNEKIFTPDNSIMDSIDRRFMQEYRFAQSVNLPVKSSASAILKMRDIEPYYSTRELFKGEGETGTERGTAYHRFLELCDFERKSTDEVKRQLESFLQSKRITAEQYELLNAEELSQILQMPVFADLKGATLLREQEFLCRLPACEILPDTTADDNILLQGAIDLVAQGDFGLKIIDYKYSHKSDEQLIETYAPQLALYKNAASIITGVSADKISCTIVNIFKRRQINLQ